MENNSQKKLLLTDILNCRYPIIMAPMFLVSNERMLIEGLKNGIAVAIPALNFRTMEDLKNALHRIRNAADGPLGVNLIVNASNIYMKEQLKTCVEVGVDFFITSLGSPDLVIKASKEKGIKVFCDVTDVSYAKKVEKLGANGIIAVNKLAGGHAGNLSKESLIRELKAHIQIPIISAGGVARNKEYQETMNLGVAGLSIGTAFIASHEAGVSNEYKVACVHYGAKDIVMTTKLSGTPCTVINTSYVQKIGTEQGWFEKLLNKNKKLKKWVKAIVFARGMKSLQKAAFSATYKTVWCAGPSIEHIHSIQSIKEIIETITQEND
jgi:nitronate monooxygenase